MSASFGDRVGSSAGLYRACWVGAGVFVGGTVAVFVGVFVGVLVNVGVSVGVFVRVGAAVDVFVVVLVGVAVDAEGVFAWAYRVATSGPTVAAQVSSATTVFCRAVAIDAAVAVASTGRGVLVGVDVPAGVAVCVRLRVGVGVFVGVGVLVGRGVGVKRVYNSASSTTSPGVTRVLLDPRVEGYILTNAAVWSSPKT